MIEMDHFCGCRERERAVQLHLFWCIHWLFIVRKFVSGYDNNCHVYAADVASTTINHVCLTLGATIATRKPDWALKLHYIHMDSDRKNTDKYQNGVHCICFSKESNSNSLVLAYLHFVTCSALWCSSLVWLPWYLLKQIENWHRFLLLFD